MHLKNVGAGVIGINNMSVTLNPEDSVISTGQSSFLCFSLFPFPLHVYMAFDICWEMALMEMSLTAWESGSSKAQQDEKTRHQKMRADVRETIFLIELVYKLDLLFV